MCDVLLAVYKLRYDYVSNDSMNCIVVLSIFLMMPKGGRVSAQVPED